MLVNWREIQRRAARDRAAARRWATEHPDGDGVLAVKP